jgi:hypothetical protein
MNRLKTMSQRVWINNNNNIIYWQFFKICFKRNSTLLKINEFTYFKIEFRARDERNHEKIKKKISNSVDNIIDVAKDDENDDYHRV